jgi:hypothetical protein
LGPVVRASPYLWTTEVVRFMEYKEEKDSMYTWKIRRQKPITNYMK